MGEMVRMVVDCVRLGSAGRTAVSASPAPCLIGRGREELDARLGAFSSWRVRGSAGFVQDLGWEDRGNRLR